MIRSRAPTHSLEFEDHRPLYDWCVDNVDFAHDDALTQPLVDAGLPREAAKPRQIEFAPEHQLR